MANKINKCVLVSALKAKLQCRFLSLVSLTDSCGVDTTRNICLVDLKLSGSISLSTCIDLYCPFSSSHKLTRQNYADA